MKLPSQLIDTDLGRWYGLSYGHYGRAPWLVVHVYLENLERLAKWAHVNRKSVFYEMNLLKGGGFHRTFVSDYGDRYLRLHVRLDGTLNLQDVMEDLDALFNLLRSARELEHEAFAHDPDRQQLMQLSMHSTPNHMREVHLGGVLSATMMDWIEAQGTVRFLEFEQAMGRIWNQYAAFPFKPSEGPNPLGPIRIETRGHNGIIIQTIGDACGVSTDEAFRRTTRHGATLGCHNMDGHLRQLTSLVGLACLHQIATLDLDAGPPDD